VILFRFAKILKQNFMKKQRRIWTHFLIIVGFIPLSIIGISSCKPSKIATSPAPKEDITKPLVLSGDSLRVAFYNVENLFDIEDDPITQDSEYIPNSSLRWTQERYIKKQKDIASVIEAMGFPSILGMVEIENRKVLQDLISQQVMQAQKYDISHFDSPDERGIDVAMIYKTADFKVNNARSHRVIFPDDVNDKTRDILEVSGILRGIPLTVFVNHFPSRRGGADESEPKRIFVAQAVKKAVDSIWAQDKNRYIIVMGDMNDEPTDKSITQGLGAIQWERSTANSLNINALYNLAAGVKAKGEGSYFYQKHWETIDQIIVSGNFLSSSSKLITGDVQAIFKPDFITFLDRSTQLKVPSRTYTGPIYRGGYSDHFPVYIPIYLKK
jgi:predicted extracellular nuclease